MKPASAAISRPPRLASAPVTSPAGTVLAQRATAAATISVLRASMASSMPVPRPVTSAASRRVKCAISAADGVVLPMPMSPVTRQAAPAATSSLATSAPTSSAALASAVVIASPVAMSPVPRLTLRCHSKAAGSRSAATPTSTTASWAPACRASTLIAAPPEQMLATICLVTSDGHGVTPDAATPWSPANTATVAGSGRSGGQRPAMAASRTPMSSSCPSEPGGLVSVSW
jgi:hypothetical protein